MFSILIPAYRPGTVLLDLVGELKSRRPDAPVLVVNDGSGAGFAEIFGELEKTPGVTVVEHAVNRGKGAALKTGLDASLRLFPKVKGIVTADADGQHLAEDIVAVAERAERESGRPLVLGCRTFEGPLPWRSKLGNVITRFLLKLVSGLDLTDTQTGLRAIPRELVPPLLRIDSAKYEFELDMLIAARHQGFPIVQHPIQAVYEPGNPTSHFNPLWDSLRIYFVLFRFSLLSLGTAAVDNLVFLAVFQGSGYVGGAQICARAVAVAFNYFMARRAVFLSDQPDRTLLPRYLALVAAGGVASYLLIGLLNAQFGVPVFGAKLLAESFLFLVNFVLQRDFIFTRKPVSGETNWDEYYRSVPPTAHLTRRYTGKQLRTAIRRFGPQRAEAVVEFGGANSCFLDDLVEAASPRDYHVVDTNAYGLELLRTRGYERARLHLHQASVLGPLPEVKGEVVFSVGLLEHFRPEDTRIAAQHHIEAVRPGGLLMVTFPTPTWLYRAARSAAEALGVWRFHDERALQPDEVRAALEPGCEVLWEKTMWPLVFTQHLIVARRRVPETGPGIR